MFRAYEDPELTRICAIMLQARVNNVFGKAPGAGAGYIFLSSFLLIIRDLRKKVGTSISPERIYSPFLFYSGAFQKVGTQDPFRTYLIGLRAYLLFFYQIP